MGKLPGGKRGRLARQKRTVLKGEGELQSVPYV